MLVTLILTLTSLSQLDEPVVAARQFARLIDGLHTEIRDVAFVYEGGAESVKKEEYYRLFQGMFAYRRSDDVFLQDVYHRDPASKGLEQRVTDAYRDGEITTVERAPDLGKRSARTRTGSPGSLNAPGSILRIVYFWFFHDIDDPDAWNYEYQGWEDVDGHRCLRVQLDELAGLARDREDRPVIRFWIDMKRGGHPRKVEWRQSDDLSMRTTVQLKQVRGDDGKAYWFPSTGITETFVTLGGYSKKPLGREIYRIVDGSVRLNSGLSDRQLSVNWRGDMPETPELASLRRESENFPPFRTDPESTQERLDKRLAEADRQAEQLEASSLARRTWGWTPTLQVVFIVLGVALLAGAIYWRRRDS